LVSIIISQQEVSEVIWQLQAHKIIFEHEEIKSKVLDPIIDIPGDSNPVFDLRFCLNKELVTLNSTSWYKQNVRVLDIFRIL